MAGGECEAALGCVCGKPDHSVTERERAASDEKAGVASHPRCGHPLPAGTPDGCEA